MSVRLDGPWPTPGLVSLVNTPLISEMNPLTLFGLFAVTLMLITYALEDR
jgi:hypothetical protein